MDTDLFQIVTLALLVANLIALLLALSVLNKVKDALSARGTTGGAATSDVSEQASAAVGTGTPEQQWGGAAATQGVQTAAGTEAGPSSSWAGATAGAAVGEETGTASIAAAEPAAASAGAPSGGGYATTQAADVATTAGSTAGSMPEEQPFERDGRWWFKRGDELLVYDEGTGQWTPAPAGAGSPSDASPAATLSQVSATATAPEAEAGFWKCPSCGAVNGSTADSCRMCFTSRP